MPLYPPSKAFYARLLERVLWTAAQAGLAVITVEQFDIPVQWAPVIATALAAVKGYVARRVGDSNDPSTLPRGV